jgi:hypothetical protein
VLCSVCEAERASFEAHRVPCGLCGEGTLGWGSEDGRWVVDDE